MFAEGFLMACTVGGSPDDASDLSCFICRALLAGKPVHLYPPLEGMLFAHTALGLLPSSCWGSRGPARTPATLKAGTCPCSRRPARL